MNTTLSANMKTVLVLKTVLSNMGGYKNPSFIYPRQGMVSCPD